MKITGKHLIEMGYRQGKWFKEALRSANAWRLTGQELTDYLDNLAPKIINPHNPGLEYIKNIRAETIQEEANLEAVYETMNELMKTPTLVKGVIMPDACPTGGRGQIPVGGVVAAVNAIHPAMHSADICCSVMMTSLGQIDPKTVLDTAQSITHFGPGGRKDTFEITPDLENKMKDNMYLRDEKSRTLGITHLGTQGDGNHFLYVGTLESTGDTVMITHHGSRGLGAHLYRQGMKVAEKFRKEISPKTLKCNAWIPYEEKEGKDYWEALQIIRTWTKLNHELLHDKTCQQLRKNGQERFWNEHNFVFKDNDLFYHAKGATPLSDQFVPDSTNGLRLVPLNMREPILVVKGESTPHNLGFAPHGAGRNISRSQHIRENSDRTIQEIFHEETRDIDVRFYSGHIDISELPTAYKNAESVQKQMKEFGLGEVVDKILPYGSIMAGNWKIDAPWKKNKRGK